MSRQRPSMNPPPTHPLASYPNQPTFSTRIDRIRFEQLRTSGGITHLDLTSLPFPSTSTNGTIAATDIALAEPLDLFRTAWTSTMHAVRGELDKFHALHSRMRTTIAELYQQRQCARALAQSVVDELNVERERVEALEGQLRQALRVRDTVERANAALALQVGEARKQAEDLQGEYLALEAEYMALRAARGLSEDGEDQENAEAAVLERAEGGRPPRRLAERHPLLAVSLASISSLPSPSPTNSPSPSSSTRHISPFPDRHPTPFPSAPSESQRLDTASPRRAYSTPPPDLELPTDPSPFSPSSLPSPPFAERSHSPPLDDLDDITPYPEFQHEDFVDPYRPIERWISSPRFDGVEDELHEAPMMPVIRDTPPSPTRAEREREAEERERERMRQSAAFRSAWSVLGEDARVGETHRTPSPSPAPTGAWRSPTPYPRYLDAAEEHENEDGSESGTPPPSSPKRDRDTESTFGEDGDREGRPSPRKRRSLDLSLSPLTSLDTSFGSGSSGGNACTEDVDEGEVDREARMCGLAGPLSPLTSPSATSSMCFGAGTPALVA